MANAPTSSPAPGSDAVAPSETAESAYWDGVGTEWTHTRPDRLWREYTDRLQIALLDRWLEAPDPPPKDFARPASISLLWSWPKL